MIRNGGSNAASRTDSFSHALLVPTHMKHIHYYCALLETIFERTAAGSPFALFSVFSSLRDQALISQACNVCSERRDIVMHSLIFPYSIRIASSRYNFQSAKKLWALSQVDAKCVLVVDSDHLFIGLETNVPAMMDAYRRVEYRGPVSPRDRLGQSAIRSSNQLLGTNFHDLVLDPPWIYRPKWVMEMLQKLARSESMFWSNSTDSIRDAIFTVLKYSAPVFEITLYRYHVRTDHPLYFNTQMIQPSPQYSASGALFEQPMSDAERALYNPPLPQTTFSKKASAAPSAGFLRTWIESNSSTATRFLQSDPIQACRSACLRASRPSSFAG